MTQDERYEILRNHLVNSLGRQGVDELVERGFLTCPASTKYHGAYEGGLFDHCFEVVKQLGNLTRGLNLNWEWTRSPHVIGFLHDLCKLDNYSEGAAGYVYSDKQLLPGHGAKSVILAQQILDLSEEEMMCIRYHMGAYEKDEWDFYDRAIRKYPNVLYVHTADMIASKICNV